MGGARAPSSCPTPQRRLRVLGRHLAADGRMAIPPCDACETPAPEACSHERDKVTTADVAMRAVRDCDTVERLTLP